MDDLGRNGATTPERYWAAWINHVFSFIVVMIVAAIVSENVPSTNNTIVDATIGFSVIGVYFAYFFFFEALISTTPGKLLFSLRIEHLDGSRCTWKASFLRTITRLLEVNPFILGCIPAGIIVRRSSRCQRWGDMLGNTIVVQKNRKLTSR